MGCGGSKAGNAVSPNGEAAGQNGFHGAGAGQGGPAGAAKTGRSTLSVDVSGPSKGKYAGQPETPNVMTYLGLNQLDENGDVSKMRALNKSQSKQPEKVGNSESSVKVAVLVRPMLPMEEEKGATNIVQVMSQSKMRLDPKALQNVAPQGDGPTFDFDRVYNVTSPQASKDMFRSLAMQITEKFCQGFNASMFAYGQTGSGKTYTMGTAIESSAGQAGKGPVAANNDGIIPRLITCLFGYVHAASPVYDIELKAQYIEIYNEQVNDLLIHAPGRTLDATNPNSFTTGSRLDIREYATGEVFVDGANSMTIRSPQDLAFAMSLGNAVRATAGHKMNEYSSRSHAIVTIHMEQKIKPNALKTVPSELHYLRSKLQMVDLAGSERAKDTGSGGTRFQEGVNINKSLLELGNCINALTDTGRKHVPYRNSKLTRVLKDSLGGSAETLMLACVSPASFNYDQTLNTLRYAQQARAIRNNLKLNNAMTLQEEVEFLRGIVAKLEEENSSLKAQVGQK